MEGQEWKRGVPQKTIRHAKQIENDQLQEHFQTTDEGRICSLSAPPVSMHLPQNEHAQRAFSIVELIVVVSVLALLSGIVAPRVSGHLRSSRDAQRLGDMKTLRAAIEQYKMDKGVYPTADTNPEFGNWDVSHDGAFIQDLVEGGYLDEVPVDPINDGIYHYRYYVYAEGSHGCQGSGPFFVLGVRNFENPLFERSHRGFFRCANRDWSDDFAYVVGGGASWSQ